AGSRPVRVALRASPPLVPGSFFEVVPEAVEVERRGVRAVVERVRAGDGPGAEGTYRAMMREEADLAVAALRRRGLICAPRRTHSYLGCNPRAGLAGE